jgi:hypothetical protein
MMLVLIVNCKTAKKPDQIPDEYGKFAGSGKISESPDRE